MAHEETNNQKFKKQSNKILFPSFSLAESFLLRNRYTSERVDAAAAATHIHMSRVVSRVSTLTEPVECHFDAHFSNS